MKSMCTSFEEECSTARLQMSLEVNHVTFSWECLLMVIHSDQFDKAMKRLIKPHHEHIGRHLAYFILNYFFNGGSTLLIYFHGVLFLFITSVIQGSISMETLTYRASKPVHILEIKHHEAHLFYIYIWLTIINFLL